MTLPKNLKEYLVYYWRYDPKIWLLFLLHDVVHYSRYAIAFLLVGRCVDVLAEGAPGAGIPEQAWWLAGGIFATLLIGESAHIWTSHILRKWRPKLRVKIRRDFFNYLIGHSHNYFQSNFAGSLARKVSEIAESSIRLHDHLRFAILGSIIQMAAVAVAMLVLSPWYVLVVAVFVNAVVIPVLVRRRKIASRARAFSEIRASVTGTIVDILSNMGSVRNFAREDYEAQRHADISELEGRADRRRMLTLIQIEVYRRISLVALGSLMMASLLAGWQAGIVTVGEVSAVMGLTFSLTGATWMLGFGIVMIADELGYIDDALRMIMPSHEITEKPDAKALKVCGGTVEFNNVDFHYETRPVFNGLTLKVGDGERIGLLGPSGAGKSTLISILLRLHDINCGQIRIDGQDIAKVTLKSLHSAISVMPQDTSLFHRSLRDNIAYGRLEATEAEIIEAAKKAHAHEFIKDLPEGYDTMVGERGVKLSGGQRQRIVIARAILKNAPILILDEATSALDSESEKLIQQSLETLMEGKTVIAIAHRLSTISHLDRLIVMQEGNIIEEGTHARLVKKNGLYAHLWAMQSGGFIKDTTSQEIGKEECISA